MSLFESHSWMLGIWEGGSAATGFLDEYSDLDLGFVVKDAHVEETFQLFEELLEKNYGIKSKLRIPEPTWHGHSQCYYFIEKCPPLFYVDVVVEKESAKDRLIEPDRHGTSQIWLGMMFLSLFQLQRSKCGRKTKFSSRSNLKVTPYSPPRLESRYFEATG